MAEDCLIMGALRVECLIWVEKLSLTQIENRGDGKEWKVDACPVAKSEERAPRPWLRQASSENLGNTRRLADYFILPSMIRRRSFYQSLQMSCYALFGSSMTIDRSRSVY